jgi:hypothetical protein
MTALETSDDIEREAEIERARLAQTLDQLRHNLTPQHLADEVLGHARHGATAVLDTLGGTAVKHPVPALLIGAGCAALLFAATGVARAASAGRGENVPAPPIAFAGNVPGPRQERDRVPAAASTAGDRWTALGERPIVTAVVGMVVGRLMAAMLRRG